MKRGGTIYVGDVGNGSRGILPRNGSGANGKGGKIDGDGGLMPPKCNPGKRLTYSSLVVATPRTTGFLSFRRRDAVISGARRKIKIRFSTKVVKLE